MTFRVISTQVGHTIWVHELSHFEQQSQLSLRYPVVMKTKDPSLIVECPICGSVSNQPCEHTLGGYRFEFHPERQELASEQSVASPINEETMLP
jgi:hypothetical protein